MIPRVRESTRLALLVICFVILCSQGSQARQVQLSNVPLVDFFSKLNLSQTFQVTKSDGLLEWIKWILNAAKAFLDPLYIGHLQIDVDEKAVSAKATGDAMTIRHLFLSEISNVKVENEKLGVSANITFPKLGLEGVYNLTGRVHDFETDLFGRGIFKVMLKDFKLYGALRLNIGNKLVLRLEDLDYSLKGLDVLLDNIMGGGAVSDVLNGVITDVGPIAADELKSDVTKVIMDAVNKALEGLIPQK